MLVRSCACPSRDAPAEAPSCSTRSRNIAQSRNVTQPSNQSRSANKASASCPKALGTRSHIVSVFRCHVVEGVKKSRGLKRRHHKHRSWEAIVQTRQVSEGLNKDDIVDDDSGLYKFIVSGSCDDDDVIFFVVYCTQ